MLEGTQELAEPLELEDTIDTNRERIYFLNGLILLFQVVRVHLQVQ